MTKSMTIVEHFDSMTDQLREAMFGAPTLSAVNWTKVKELLGQFLQAFGPVILQIVLSLLTPPPAE